MSRPFSRRALLLGAGAAVALSGCRIGPVASPSPPTPTALPTPRSTEELLALRRFVVAHRGSGDNWPEHTLRAYQSALRAGAQAVEVSVRRTADGVLVCHHDADTLRVTGKKGLVADLAFADLAARPVNAKAWLGPAIEPEPIPKLEAVLAELPRNTLIFIEDKDGTNTEQLLDLVLAQPDAANRFIWKQWAAAEQVRAATDAGLRAWGYFTTDILDRVGPLAGRFDALGIGVEQSDAVIRELVATGRPVIAWEVHRRSERDRLHALGVSGLMCSNVPYVRSDSVLSVRDRFADGLRAAGDLPMITNASWSEQPVLQDGRLTISDATTGRVYTMGSVGPLPENYRLEVGLRFDKDPAKTGAGFAFAAESDAAYAPEADNRYGAYRVKLWPSGLVELADHPVGWAEPRPLASFQGKKPVKGEEIRIAVDVTPYRLKLSAPGSGEQATVADMNHRGGYLHLWAQAWPVTFSGISVT